MYNYTEPKKTHNGMWESTATRKDGKSIDKMYTCNIVQFTTKKGLTDWIKNHKKENKGLKVNE